jgi:hypothetical protein
VPPADIQYSPRPFLKAIDTNEGLRARLQQHEKQWALLTLFRTEFGDTCGRTRGVLSLLWSLELQKDKGAFFSLLRGAGY